LAFFPSYLFVTVLWKGSLWADNWSRCPSQ